MATKVKPQTKGKDKGTVESKGTKKAKGRKGFKISETPYDVAMPDGFNFDDYKPLKKKNFAQEYTYFEHRALAAEHRAAKFRQMAKDSKKYGSTADRAKARRLVKLQTKMEELKTQLIEQGVDVEQLLAT